VIGALLEGVSFPSHPTVERVSNTSQVGGLALGVNDIPVGVRPHCQEFSLGRSLFDVRLPNASAGVRAIIADKL
jgi:hypothetical protein